MGGLGSPYGQPGHHSPNGGGSVSSKRTINRSEWESRCLWLSVLPFRSANYIDGPHHDYPERQTRDAAKTEAMEDLGYMVIRFGHQDDWDEIIDQYPYVFGSGV